MAETKIIDGKQIAKEFREKLAQKVQKLGSTPKLAVLVVGEHPASQIYVQNKKKAALSVGIDVDIYQMAVSETQESILNLINELNEAKDVDGWTPLVYASSKGHFEIVQYLQVSHQYRKT